MERNKVTSETVYFSKLQILRPLKSVKRSVFDNAHLPCLEIL